MIRRLLPHPLLSLGIGAASVLMSGGTAAPSLALAVVCALALPHSLRTLGVEPVRARRPQAMLRLAALVVVDVLRSNWAVAQIIVSGRRRERTSGFIHVPLDLRDTYGLAVLAIILTGTPGTLWVEYDRQSGRLLLHVLDLVDEETWITLIKTRYERLLMEIFE